MLQLLFLMKKSAKHTDLCLIWHETEDTLLFLQKLKLYICYKNHTSLTLDVSTYKVMTGLKKSGHKSPFWILQQYF